IPRLGLPPYQWWSESLHGIATNGPGISFNGTIKAATMFPQILNQAATFNKTLWFDIASATSVEGRSMYNVGQSGLTFWAPNINIFRDPRWGRGQETPGEDPLLVSAFAVEFVKGFQREDDAGGLMLSACCTVNVGIDIVYFYINWIYGVLTRSDLIPDIWQVNQQDMEDSYQPPFKNCIKRGNASCLMCSYNSVNGVPACAKGDLLQKARNEWGFEGYVASDCDAVATIYEYQHYVNAKEDAVADALKAGVDINCGTYMLLNAEFAFGQGKIDEEDLDRALKNLFPVLLRLGLFDGDPLKGKFGKLDGKDVCTEEHQRLSLEGAKQSIVLLKNNKNFLPLSKDDVSSLAIIGPGANDLSQLGGGYSGRIPLLRVPCNAKTYADDLQMYIKQTSYIGGCFNVTCESDSMFAEAISVARKSDYVILVLGLDLSQETEDKDRVSLLLPGKQMDLVSLVAAVCKRPLILVLTGGGPLDVSFAKGDPRIASILWVGYPGEAGGKALAQVIFGDYNPGGRLPMTWYPESFTKIPMNDMNMRADPSRLYPGRTHRFYTGETVYKFGHGLSYTNYSYKLLSAPEIINLLKFTKADESVRKLYQTEAGIAHIPIDDLSCDSLRFDVKISVMNIGNLDGSHVVMLYSKALLPIKGGPRKQLVGFSRVHATAQGSAEASFDVDPCEHLSFANEHGKRILPLGEHILMLGDMEHSLVIAI
ncbi:hypothetical protein KSS87_010293, partial [Heliosperma pusillum]